MEHNSYLPRLAIAVAAVLWPASASSQQPRFPVDFSATQFDYASATPKDAQAVGKLLVSKGRVRVEDTDGPGTKMIKLFDPQSGQMWLLMPEHKLAMNAPVPSGELHSPGSSSSSSLNLNPIDANAPCATLKGVTCRSVGMENVNGRDAHKWDVTEVSGPHPNTSHIWIDPKLWAIVKRQDHRSGMELRNVKEGPQTEVLFSIPAGYRKISQPN